MWIDEILPPNKPLESWFPCKCQANNIMSHGFKVLRTGFRASAAVFIPWILKALPWMDEILHHLETIVCWYLQGNQPSRVSEVARNGFRPSTVGRPKGLNMGLPPPPVPMAPLQVLALQRAEHPFIVHLHRACLETKLTWIVVGLVSGREPPPPPPVLGDCKRSAR